MDDDPARKGYPASDFVSSATPPASKVGAEQFEQLLLAGMLELRHGRFFHVGTNTEIELEKGEHDTSNGTS